VKTVIYAVSVGAKLFVLQLIAGLGAQVIGAWANLPAGQSVIAPVNATSNILVIVGSTLVLSVLVKTVPDMIQGLMNGSALGMNTGLAGRPPHSPAAPLRLAWQSMPPVTLPASRSPTPRLPIRHPPAPA
jgi:hypothetical protein